MRILIAAEMAKTKKAPQVLLDGAARDEGPANGGSTLEDAETSLCAALTLLSRAWRRWRPHRLLKTVARSARRKAHLDDDLPTI